MRARATATSQVALVGCGGRGTGAALNALATRSGPIKIVAMADVFKDRLGDSRKQIEQGAPKQLDVPEERQFIGFDAYKQAMDCLRAGDVAIFATPPAFRWVHFAYAIEKGLNVFMEKPVIADGPSARKMFKLGEESVKRNLKVGVGLMCRHCDARGEQYKHIKDGMIGDLVLLRAYPHGRTDRDGVQQAAAEGHQRTGISDSPLPLVPVGQRRQLQRLPDPQHRRVLLDEGRLAGQGAGVRRPPLPRQQHRPELRHLLDRVHLRRRRQAATRRPHHDRLRAEVRELRPRH